MSFLKKISRIAAPFASLIPGVGPFIGAGMGLLGGLGGGGGSKGQQNPVTAQLLAQMQRQSQFAEQTYNTGKPLLDEGASTMRQPLSYYSNILAGGKRGEQALAGPRQDLVQGYNRGMQNTAAFAPRGSTASAYADQSRLLSSGLSRLRLDSMNNAASNLLGGGNALLGAGSNLMSSGMSGMNAATGNLLQNRSLDLQADANKQQMWGGLGEGLGGILSTLLMPGGILNKGKSGGSGGNANGLPAWTSISGLFGGGD